MTVDDILTSSHYHSSRPRHWPPTAIMLSNAGDLCSRVNKLLAEFKKVCPKFEPERRVNSGYRPPAVTDVTAGAIHGDAHESCQAVDLEDGDGRLAKFVVSHEALIKSLGLYIEDPRYTRTIPEEGRRGWVHFQNRVVPSGHTIFIPYAGPPP